MHTRSEPSVFDPLEILLCVAGSLVFVHTPAACASINMKFLSRGGLLDLSPTNYIMSFVVTQHQTRSTDWQSIAASIPPYSKFLAGGVVSESERTERMKADEEEMRCVLDAELTRILQQADLSNSLTGTNVPWLTGPSVTGTGSSGHLSELEAAMYSLLLALKLFSSTSYKESSTTCLEAVLLKTIWELSLYFGELLPEGSSEEPDQFCHQAKSLVALLARVVISSFYTDENGIRQMLLEGEGTTFHFPFDVLCSFLSLHSSVQHAAAAEIGCEGKMCWDLFTTVVSIKPSTITDSRSVA